MLLDRVTVQQNSQRVQSNLRFAGLQEGLSSQASATRCVAQQYTTHRLSAELCPAGMPVS